MECDFSSSLSLQFIPVYLQITWKYGCVLCICETINLYVVHTFRTDANFSVAVFVSTCYSLDLFIVIDIYFSFMLQSPTSLCSICLQHSAWWCSALVCEWMPWFVHSWKIDWNLSIFLLSDASNFVDLFRLKFTFLKIVVWRRDTAATQNTNATMQSSFLVCLVMYLHKLVEYRVNNSYCTGTARRSATACA